MIKHWSILFSWLFLSSFGSMDLTASEFTWRVGAASVEMRADDNMVIGGGIGPGYVQGQEGKLQATALFIQGDVALCILAVDVLMMHRDTMDLATERISQVCRIPRERIMINASHTHHAPSTVTIHGYQRDEEFCLRTVDSLVAAARLAQNRSRLSPPSRGLFALGQETSVGQNSRLLLDDGQIYWIGPRDNVIGTTDPFDPDLPVVAFRSADSQLQAALFNHSTHCIGTRSGLRSPGFYGLAAQELSDRYDVSIAFLSGAAGSTHNLVLDADEMVRRIKAGFDAALEKAEPMQSTRLAAIRREVPFLIRMFDEQVEDEKVVRYCRKYAPAHADAIIDVFRDSRRQLKSQQGRPLSMWLQVLQIGDVYLVGVPAEFFTVLGLEIKRRSPFPHTFVCGLSNDYVGYLPDRKGHDNGGYQTWMGLHSFAAIGTGEMVVGQCLEMLNELSAASGQERTAENQITQGQTTLTDSANLRATELQATESQATEPQAVNAASTVGVPNPAAQGSRFLAGAAAVDITPTDFPRIIAGGFLEGRGDQIHDRLYVRTLVMDDGVSQLVMAIVDTCMMPQPLIDRAKQLAAEGCGIPAERMMVSATHTHSAPAAMGCLGTRLDEEYAAWLPQKIAESIIAAHRNLQPARVGWAATDDWHHTHNRRWVRHPDRMIVDPFGNATGRAHMHPGYESPDVIGPSGPVDPELSILSVQTLDATPLAVIANYGQHYFGAPAISADYFGAFAKYVADFLGQPGDGNGPFVCAMSQGTSGDLASMDYGGPAQPRDMHRYAEAIARFAEQALQSIEYRDFAELDVVETHLPLNYRTPDRERLDWAAPIAEKIENDVPKSLPEVYAREAIILHERQGTELKLQVLRIGDLTIAAIPNEVYALTGLKLKAQAPSAQHFNVELANGAEGYIPPPEQHVLGGYTTWPARTAGLEVQAEPKIVESLLELLEQVTGQPRRTMTDQHGAYARAVLASEPTDYWRLNDADGVEARNAVRERPSASITPGFGWYLPGVGSGSGVGREVELKTSAFSGPTQINRSVHLAGGRLETATQDLGQEFSIGLWFWLGARSGARERRGNLIMLPNGQALVAEQFDDHRVRLQFQEQSSKFDYQADEWNFVVLVRSDNKVCVYVNGSSTPVLVSSLPESGSQSDTQSGLLFGDQLLGKLDEIAVWDRALDPSSIEKLFALSEILVSPPISNPDATPSTTATPHSPPLSPGEGLKSIHVPDGFRVELVAAEPHVLDPVAFDWDEFGRLWVVEMADYPMGMDGAGQPGGRIRRLEDRDGDGYFETSILFAEGLNFPNGILTWGSGVIVTAAPEILYLADTTGDGIANLREVWLSGFNEGNQQLRVNGLRWGLDGWVYCANGGHHAGYGREIQVLSHRNGQRLTIGSRDFRFHPETGQMQLESGPSQFGRNRDAWGHWFGTQNANPLWQYVIPDRYLHRNPYVPTPSPIRHVMGSGSPPVYPASSAEKRYHSFEQSGRFTSACGGMIYGDERLFPPSSEVNRVDGHSFVCEPFHNLVQHQLLEEAGPSYISSRIPDLEHDFVASHDRWCRPVMVRTGPDGALWVADMYRYMIEHPDWLPPEGREELLPHYRLGDDRGRLYRVVRKGESFRPNLKLHEMNVMELSQALDSANDWQRDKIQQLLLKAKESSTVPHLIEVATHGRYPQARLQALYLLRDFGALSEDLLVAALHDPHQRVRQNALRLAEEFSSAQVLQAAAELRHDQDAKVRFQLALSCGQWSEQIAGQALAAVALQDFHDSLAVAAVMSSAVPHLDFLLSALLSGPREAMNAFREPLLRHSLGSNNAGAITRILGDALEGSFDQQCLRLGEFTQALQRLHLTLEQLAGEHPSEELAAQIASANACLQRARSYLQQEDAEDIERMAAATLLVQFVSDRNRAVEVLSEKLQPHVDGQRQSQVISAIGSSGAENVPPSFALAWEGLSHQLRSQAIDVWLSRAEWAADLLVRISDDQISKSSLDLAQQTRLLQYPESSVALQARDLFSRESQPKEVLQRYRIALELSGDVERGRAVYVESCASCHRRGDLGTDIGPNLATVLSHSPERLLTNILDPNADIQPGYQSVTCMLDSGEILTGLLAGESSHSLTMVLADGSLRTIIRSEIEQLRNSGISLMPEGLEEKISQQAMADLIAFLRSALSDE